MALGLVLCLLGLLRRRRVGVGHAGGLPLRGQVGLHSARLDRGRIRIGTFGARTTHPEVCRSQRKLPQARRVAGSSNSISLVDAITLIDYPSSRGYGPLPPPRSGAVEIPGHSMPLVHGLEVQCNRSGGTPDSAS